jgi:ribonuclease P/MRP protein subunit POP7
MSTLEKESKMPSSTAIEIPPSTRTTVIKKHSANVLQRLSTEAQATFLVKSTTPYVYAIKKIDKIIGNFTSKKNLFKNVHYITVKGMGKAILKTANIGMKFQTDGTYRVDFLTGSVEVLDEILGDDDEDESQYKKRMVSYLEVRIWIK